MGRRIAILALCATLAACGRMLATGGHVKDIGGLVPDLAFAMTDERGQAVTQADYRGAPVLVFFGFSHCVDECPTTLADLSKAIRAAGARDARVLFVTVDPARDTTARLDEYVHAFGGPITGLRGTDAQLAALARRYRVGFSLGEPDAKGGYDVNHSSAVFGFDAQGRARLLVLPGASAAEMQAAVARLERSRVS